MLYFLCSYGWTGRGDGYSRMWPCMQCLGVYAGPSVFRLNHFLPLICTIWKLHYTALLLHYKRNVSYGTRELQCWHLHSSSPTFNQRNRHSAFGSCILHVAFTIVHLVLGEAECLWCSTYDFILIYPDGWKIEIANCITDALVIHFRFCFSALYWALWAWMCNYVCILWGNLKGDFTELKHTTLVLCEHDRLQVSSINMPANLKS